MWDRRNIVDLTACQIKDLVERNRFKSEMDMEVCVESTSPASKFFSKESSTLSFTTAHCFSFTLLKTQEVLAVNCNKLYSKPPCNVKDNTSNIDSITQSKSLVKPKDSTGYMQRLIPDEVLLKICSFSAAKDLAHLACTCKRLQELCRDESLWKRLYHLSYQLEYPLQKSPTNNLYELVNIISGPGRPEISWRKYYPLLNKAEHVCQDERLVLCLQNLGRKCYQSIQEAVDNSSGLVIIHSGTYKESLEINKPVTLLGAGVPGGKHEVHLTHTNETIMKFSQGGSKSHIAFVRFSVQRTEPNTSARCNCIEICNDSSPTIQDCHITSKSSCAAAVHIHGAGSSPKILRCKITECENVGLFISEGAQGTYEDNDICANRLAGIWVKSGANPIMKRNEVHHGKDAGFFIFDGGMGYYEENDVHSNRIAGIEVRSGANPTVVRCHIHHGFTGGIYVHDDGRGEFMCNRIHTNTFAGVWVTSGSNPTIKDNEIYHGQQGGIYVFGDGRGLVENNDIHGNALAGIQIRSNSNPIVRKNRIHHGLHGGIYIHEGGMGLIEDNEIYANTLAGIWITTGSAPILRHNRIHSGKQVGVYFYDKGCGTLENNEIYNHKYSGIQIRSGSNPVIRQNKIWGGKNGGVLIYNGGQGILEDNEIFDNAMAGVWIKTESNPILRRNKIHDGHEGGVCIFNNGKGLLEENDIFRNSLTGVLISTSSMPVLRRNRIFEGGAAGIEITNGAGGIFERNEVFNNRFDGICLATGVNPKMLDNNCHDNKRALSEAIEAGKCLYQVSGSVCYPMHDFYRCITCSSTENFAICVNCIKNCHGGHDVEFVRHDRFFCDCGAGTTSNPCKLTSSNDTIGQITKSKSPRAGRSPRAPKRRGGTLRCSRSRTRNQRRLEQMEEEEEQRQQHNMEVETSPTRSL
ncbi:F-box only protein 11-like isoform X1 [Hydractinia symbiolongicarpus]|uniref:F-box only protein 11-like isoform X1 n=2 Tax=Hydractinia symbiolongicarpus TaxID=13093 RepID=UPI00254F3F96|nr:F-box only protein 11-like isoform X1 [Hydractinia symbiolongicarpus]